MKIRKQTILTDALYALTYLFGRYEQEWDCDGCAHRYFFGPIRLDSGVGQQIPTLSCHGPVSLYVQYEWYTDLNPVVRWLITRVTKAQKFAERIKKFMRLNILTAKHLSVLLKYKGVAVIMLKANWISSKQ